MSKGGWRTGRGARWQKKVLRSDGFVTPGIVPTISVWSVVVGFQIRVNLSWDYSRVPELGFCVAFIATLYAGIPLTGSVGIRGGRAGSRNDEAQA